jgi:2-phosphosulfolactate phosphatase
MADHCSFERLDRADEFCPRLRARGVAQRALGVIMKAVGTGDGEIAMRLVRVHFLPQSFSIVEGESDTCVVIDVLRATTTILHALDAGAQAVIPCLTIDEARRRAADLPPGQAVLGGERHGLAIEGFDLGNSPAEYSRESVGGKTVVLTTTNGTRALLCAAAAPTILVGAFVNLSAVCGRVAACSGLDLLCAGTDGHVTDEDILFAGAVAHHLVSSSVGQLDERETSSGQRGGRQLDGWQLDKWQLDNGAAEARARWLSVVGRHAAVDLRPALVEALLHSRGGKNLLAIGLAGDIPHAADVDRLSIVARFDPASGRIEVEG